MALSARAVAWQGDARWKTADDLAQWIDAGLSGLSTVQCDFDDAISARDPATGEHIQTSRSGSFAWSAAEGTWARVRRTQQIGAGEPQVELVEVISTPRMIAVIQPEGLLWKVHPPLCDGKVPTAPEAELRAYLPNLMGFVTGLGDSGLGLSDYVRRLGPVWADVTVSATDSEILLDWKSDGSTACELRIQDEALPIATAYRGSALAGSSTGELHVQCEPNSGTGIPFPATITQHVGNVLDERRRITLRDVRLNEAVPPGRFELPAPGESGDRARLLARVGCDGVAATFHQRDGRWEPMETQKEGLLGGPIYLSESPATKWYRLRQVLFFVGAGALVAATLAGLRRIRGEKLSGRKGNRHGFTSRG